jgi:hypothetical protein
MYEIDSGDFNAAELAKKHNCVATKGVGKLGYNKWKDAGSLHPALKGVKMVSLRSRCVSVYPYFETC